MKVKKRNFTHMNNELIQMSQGQRKMCPSKILMESLNYETNRTKTIKKPKVFMIWKTISAFRMTPKYNPEDKIKWQPGCFTPWGTKPLFH